MPDPLPDLLTPHTPDEVLRRLDLAARRGRMAGFKPEPAPPRFSVVAFASPFEHKLVATAAPAPAGSRLSFRAVMLPKLPWIYAIVIALCIWPGVWLTHSMLVTWFNWYFAEEWKTWAWYIPLTVIPLPWAIRKLVGKSRAEAHTDALAQIDKLRAELDAAPPSPAT
jgi:hypothetical protein